ncbi:MAG TPA: phosphoesterase [Eubacterium sp.]|nr:phosphoesterase [Eubacterium sp.]HBZ53428.1 phosphoesterase [Eubacterium sp.]
MSKLIDLFKKNKSVLFFVYPLIYLAIFFYLEKNIQPTHIIYSEIDGKIPFCEYFIIPYDIWFAYIVLTYIVLFLFSRKDFVPTATIMTIGMTVFLITSFIYPNGLPSDFRPNLDSLNRDNFCIRLVRSLYASDTSTNVFPSIHVFNSLGATYGLCKCNKIPKPVKYICILLCLSIIASTVFLKQHSIIDCFGGIVLGIVMIPVYNIVKEKCL